MKEMVKKIGKLVVVCLQLGVAVTILLESVGFWIGCIMEPSSIQHIIQIGNGWAFAVMPIITVFSGYRTVVLFKKYRRTKLIEIER